MQTPRSVGWRLDPELVAQIGEYANQTERSVTNAAARLLKIALTAEAKRGEWTPSKEIR